MTLKNHGALRNEIFQAIGGHISEMVRYRAGYYQSLTGSGIRLFRWSQKIIDLEWPLKLVTTSTVGTILATTGLLMTA